MNLSPLALGQGPSRMSQDSEVPPGWECASSGALQPPLTSAPEVKRPTQAARKEAKEPKKVTQSPPPAGWGRLGRGLSSHRQLSSYTGSGTKALEACYADREVCTA